MLNEALPSQAEHNLQQPPKDIIERGKERSWLFNHEKGIKDFLYKSSVVAAYTAGGLVSGVILSEHMSNLTRVAHFSTDTNCLFYAVTTGMTTLMGIGAGILQSRR